MATKSGIAKNKQSEPAIAVKAKKTEGKAPAAKSKQVVSKSTNNKKSQRFFRRIDC